jgi:hypothetical protein
MPFRTLYYFYYCCRLLFSLIIICIYNVWMNLCCEADHPVFLDINNACIAHFILNSFTFDFPFVVLTIFI